MELLQSVVLGIVQGLAEFLPISSSGHLIVIPWLFGWQDHGLTFDVALHLGTLGAVFIYFRKTWWDLTKACFKLNKFRDLDRNIDQRLIVYLVLGSIPAALVGLFLESIIESVFRQPLLVASTLGSMGVVIWACDRFGKKTLTVEGLTLSQVLQIGLAQCLALVPGVSRSGITMAAALKLGMKRAEAAKFSFLLSFPITLGACLLKLRHLTVSDLTLQFVIGVVVSGFTGWLAIGGLIRFLQKQSFGVFAVYRLIFAGIIFSVYFLR
ncbi:MAG: undecaprenyl-diphosphatase UppP [Oligoflexia bacterium]|nr:undecaprenyl-diphosphatase UppP [Oligoflexia bacterium]